MVPRCAAHLLPLAVVAASALLWTVDATAGLPEEAKRYCGTWDHVGGDAEEQARIDTIETVVQKMPRVLRAIARKRLTKRTIIPTGYVIEEAAGDQLTVTTTSGDVWTTPLDGSVTEFIYDGDSFVLSRQMVGDEIHCHAEQSIGASDYIYRLSDGDQTLTITAITASQHLPDTITYHPTYRRR